MRPRHFLARIAAFVTVAAAIAMLLGPARADAAEADGSAIVQQPGSRVDGWANRDMDIGTF
jgi:hypothetical protein